MSEQPPTLLIADADAPGQAKQRRRPALSCVECRIRKVKCDRKKPCGGCTRIKSTSCTYRAERRHGFLARPSRSPAPTSMSMNGEHSVEQGNNRKSQDIEGPTVSEFDAIVNRYVAPGFFGEHGKAKLGPLPTNRPSLALSSRGGQSLGDPLVQTLLKKVEELERKMAARVGGGGEGEQGVLTVVGESDDDPVQGNQARGYERSHWKNALEPYDGADASTAANDAKATLSHLNKSTEMYATVARVKAMIRTLEAPIVNQPALPADIQDLIPSKDVCDTLITGYLRNFEGVFRVLHIPTFREEYTTYFTSPPSAHPTIILKILLVCAIGIPFHPGPSQLHLKSTAAKWIDAADHWLCGPHFKSRHNITSLQIRILLILARQVCNVDGDHVWIPAGALLRTAMHLGLHRDPTYYAHTNILQMEMRRRLWATVLEITVQSSLDMGMPPMISANDYDSKVPLNLNDEDICEGAAGGSQGQRQGELRERPAEEITDSSVQIAFCATLPMRLEIIRLTNNLRFDLSYDDVLRLGAEISASCAATTARLSAAFTSSLRNGSSGREGDATKITPFQIKLLDCLVRRFILCLHRPYLTRATLSPRYTPSRKICLENALFIFAPATDSSSYLCNVDESTGNNESGEHDREEAEEGNEDDWTLATHHCAGFFKSLLLFAVSTVYYEVNAQLDEQARDAAMFQPIVRLHPRPHTTSHTPNTTSALHSPTTPISPPSQFRLLHNTLTQALYTAKMRLHLGETNPKGMLFIACALARIDARVRGGDAHAAVLKTAKEVVRECGKVMGGVYERVRGVRVDLAGEEMKEVDEGDTEREKNLEMGNHARSGAEQNTPPPPLTSDAPPFSNPNAGLNSSSSTPDVNFDAFLGDQGLNLDLDMGMGMDMAYEFAFDNSWQPPGAVERGANWFLDVNGWAAAGMGLGGF